MGEEKIFLEGIYETSADFHKVLFSIAILQYYFEKGILYIPQSKQLRITSELTPHICLDCQRQKSTLLAAAMCTRTLNKSSRFLLFVRNVGQMQITDVTLHGVSRWTPSPVRTQKDCFHFHQSR